MHATQSRRPEHVTHRTEDPFDFEQQVARYIQTLGLGYEVIVPPANTKGYDLELRKGEDCIAVQIKNHRAKNNIGQIQKFAGFLEIPAAQSKFTAGWFISGSGFSKSALTHVETDQSSNLSLGTFQQGALMWNYCPKVCPWENGVHSPALAPERTEQTYIGVFTCKGGVGKTTVAAHLAGAFALMGYDVILLDLDPDKNLRKLFLQDASDLEGDASLYVPPRRRGQEGAVITVLNQDQWRAEDYPDTKIIICDCSPTLSENSDALVQKFKYCIVPTTLNPLGVSKNADVITRTFDHIRQQNSEAELFTVINSYRTGASVERKNDVMLRVLEQSLAKAMQQDSKCKFIPPDVAKIRYSDQLLYWGYHIVDGTAPRLAFQPVGGRCYPRTDFLTLAEYLEDHTNIDALRNK